MPTAVVDLGVNCFCCPLNLLVQEFSYLVKTDLDIECFTRKDVGRGIFVYGVCKGYAFAASNHSGEKHYAIVREGILRKRTYKSIANPFIWAVSWTKNAPSLATFSYGTI